jgi:LytS/YehU family sensor histidine kinase
LLSGLANALLQRFYVPLLMPNHISFSFLNSGIIFLAKSIDIGIITVIFIFIYLVQFYYNKEQRNKLLEKERLEAELNYLKSQINPHFLFNALNSIYVLMKEDVKQAEDTLLKFSALLRYQIYDCSHDKTTLKSELEFLKNYVALENIRNGENRLVNFIVPEIINHQIIAPFVLIPFIENAFKHISSHTNSTNKIEIVISENKNILVLDVKNSFDEVVQSTHENHIGIGLQNIKRRLELLYPKKYWLTIAKEEQLFCVNLKLELDEN